MHPFANWSFLFFSTINERKAGGDAEKMHRANMVKMACALWLQRALCSTTILTNTSNSFIGVPFSVYYSNQAMLPFLANGCISEMMSVKDAQLV
jgi:hypothetical protein